MPVVEVHPENLKRWFLTSFDEATATETGDYVLIVRDGATYALPASNFSGGGGGGQVPSGTGFVHVTSGVQDAAAKLVANSDVASGAGIVEAKLALDFPTHSNANDPSNDEKDALAGTSGAPSAANKYVTDSDSRLTDSRTPTAHASSHYAAGSDPVDVTQLSGFPGGGTTFLRDDGTFAVAGSGTVTSVDVSGGSTGLTFSGGPIVASGTITMSGTLAVGYGGTGVTSLTANGVLYGGTSVGATAAMTDGQLLVGQTSAAPLPKTVSGDATMAATGALTLANSGVTAATYGSATQSATVTVDAKGRITTASNTLIVVGIGNIEAEILARLNLTIM